MSEDEQKKKVVVVEEVEEVKTPEVVEEKEKQPEVIVEVEKHEDDPEKTNYLWIIIPTALLVGTLVGGLITYFSGVSKLDNAIVTPSPVAVEKEVVETIPTASPSSTIKRSEIKLQVLNGSGIAGLAGKAKTYLEDLGYLDVAVGNATKSDFTDSVVSVKNTSKEFSEAVIADLSKNYSVAKETETLSTTSKYDFVITLGNK